MDRYVDLAGDLRFFDLAACERFERLGWQGYLFTLVARTPDGVWVRGVFMGRSNAEVCEDAPIWERLVLEWSQISLAGAATYFGRDLPDSLISDARRVPMKSVEAASPIVLKPVVNLGASQQDKPVVFGVEKPRLTVARYKIVRTLIEAGPKGLSSFDLVQNSGHTDAVRSLGGVARLDADWGRAVLLAGTAWGRYRVKHEPSQG